jgi:MoaA/NifB/PqqE/SkfB family radical SAM enzyme
MPRTCFTSLGSFSRTRLATIATGCYGQDLVSATTSPPPVSPAVPNIFFRLRYSPFLTQMVVIRRCNLSCGYCSEYDKTSDPVPVQVLEDRLRKLKELGTFGISLTGGEPTLHPDLPRIIRTCRELRFYRTSMITNGFLLNPKMIETLNQAGLQKMQISIDGVHGNETTQKVLNNLKKRLQWLRDHARFPVVISSVIGASPPEEAEEVVSFALKMGFSSRVLLVHDSHGQIKLNAKEIKTFQKIVDMLPRRWPELSSYRKRLIHTGSAPFKCRAGSRYLYVDEYGRVNWCSQTRTVWSKALMDYTPNDLREQFYNYKPCHATCTLNCSRSNSYFDNWRRQPGFSS